MLEAEAEASVEAARSAAAGSVSEANVGIEVYILGHNSSEICPEMGGFVDFLIHTSA